MTRLLSIVMNRKQMELSTEFVYPPIPCRNSDWSAIDSNTFDADYDCESGSFVTRCPIGRGATESEAIEDLLDQMEEHADVDTI